MTNTELKKIREGKNLTKKELAALLGVTPLLVSRYESGSSKIPEDVETMLADIISDMEDDIVEAAEILEEEAAEAAEILEAEAAEEAEILEEEAAEEEEALEAEAADAEEAFEEEAAEEARALEEDAAEEAEVLEEEAAEEAKQFEKEIKKAGGKKKTEKEEGQTGRVTCRSSKPEVVKVTKKGKLKALKKGKATITITVNGKKEKIKVVVGRCK